MFSPLSSKITFPARTVSTISAQNICHSIAGDFEREQPAVRMSIILAELLKVVGDAAVSVG
jgi:hypothetical protein